MILRALLVVLLGFSLGAASVPRTLVLVGTLTNTTADIAGETRLTLTIAGETVTATIKTEQPLAGTGKLTGQFRNGWLELTGKLDEGLTLQLRGALNARDYLGTYIAGVPGEPIQYGKFQLALKK